MTHRRGGVRFEVSQGGIGPRAPALAVLGWCFMSDSEDIVDPLIESDAPRPKAPPILSRFLYVDVASLRAKQLRRGALSRLDPDDLDSMHVIPHKAERIAMEEVKRCLVLYDVPENKKPEF